MILHIEVEHESVSTPVIVNTFDSAYALALSDTYEPVMVEDITPKSVSVGAYAFASDFERANLQTARANTYGLNL